MHEMLILCNKNTYYSFKTLWLGQLNVPLWRQVTVFFDTPIII